MSQLFSGKDIIWRYAFGVFFGRNEQGGNALRQRIGNMPKACPYVMALSFWGFVIRGRRGGRW